MLQTKPSRSLSHHTKINNFMKKFIDTNYKESIPSSMKQSRQNKQVKSIERASNVYKIELLNVQQNVCLKQRTFNKQEKERELLILKAMTKYKHPCIVELRHHFINNNMTNMVFDFMPMNLAQIIESYRNREKEIPIILVKSFTFQLIRAVAHLHEYQICHRNIQPENILINNVTFQLKLTDFSQAKFLYDGEESINTVNQVKYRAPELLFGALKYSRAIDLWAVGCIVYEMLKLTAAFDGNTSEEVLAEIIKVLGVPKKYELVSMNSQYGDLKMPQITKKDWQGNETIEFVKQFIKYTPSHRGKASEYLHHPYFREIMSGEIRLNGKELPNIGNYTKSEQRCLQIY